jgi:Fe/S biogenesis protein NfuA
MGGGCQGCSMSAATLKSGVETTLRTEIPEITEILDTTDHASGANPYFQA